MKDGLNESELIERLCRHANVPAPPRGPGDDASLEGDRVTTTDVMIEDVHFLRAHPPGWLGRKLLAVNLSDIGAMGAVPSAFLLTASLPQDTPSAWWEAVSVGVGGLAAEAGVSLLGGDVTGSPGPVMLGVTAWGQVGPAGPLLRSGGRPGDLLMIHKEPGIGRSSLGLERWRVVAGSDWGSDPLSEPDPCLLAHLCPETSWHLGPWAADAGASAGMDCSDGLLTDVPRLAAQSQVAIEVELAWLPKDSACDGMSPDARADGGEDYGLLLLVPPQCRTDFERAGFSVLGHAVRGHGVAWCLNGRVMTPRTPRFAHFTRY